MPTVRNHGGGRTVRRLVLALMALTAPGVCPSRAEDCKYFSALPDDYYYFDQASHSLIGQRTKRRYRLGDKVRVKVARVDLQKRQADLKVIERKKETDRRRRD